MGDKVFFDAPIGPEAHVKLELKAGNVIGTVAYAGADMEGSLAVTVKTRAGLDSLKKLIPGQIDDIVIGAIEAVLGL